MLPKDVPTFRVTSRVRFGPQANLVIRGRRGTLIGTEKTKGIACVRWRKLRLKTGRCSGKPWSVFRTTGRGVEKRRVGVLENPEGKNGTGKHRRGV